MFFDELFGKFPNGFGFGIRKTARVDDFFDLRNGELDHGPRGFGFGKEFGSDGINAQVSALSRKEHGNQQSICAGML